jgi:CRP-like cAMP-binding protein
MLPYSERSARPPSASEKPVFLPLNGEALQQTIESLLRKGATLVPKLQEWEAHDICASMALEHFHQGAFISFNAQDMGVGRTMLILMGEVNIRVQEVALSASRYSPVDEALGRWQGLGEGTTIGLVHAFSGLSSRFMAQATTELFVASMTRQAFADLKQKTPLVALRYFELLAREMVMIMLDHERRMVAMSNVARSMQNHIDSESGATRPAGLF